MSDADRRPPEERIEELASVISHDLQNPLTIANGYLTRARMDGSDEYFDHVEDALDEIQAISEDLVVLARLGHPVRSTEPIVLGTIATTAWIERGLPEQQLVVDCDDVVPIVGHSDRVLELLERLFDNAVRHGPADVTVKITRTEHGFAISDDGPGIPADQCEEALTAGYSTVQQRPGLGLTIVRAIVDAHGWQLSLSESDDGGLCVEISGVDRGSMQELKTDVRL